MTVPNLSVPEQKLTTLSYCKTNPKQLDAWLKELPMANIGETAKRLYHAIIEINQLVVAPAARFQLMETIRDAIYYVCAELEKHILNQSIVLPEKQRKIANLAQALQLHLANGYKLVIHNQLAEDKSAKAIRQLVPACHRAICDLSRCVVRACQLYCQAPPDVWLEIHQLYVFAHDHEFDDEVVQDKHLNYSGQTSIAAAYKRVLLLGCCKPNQMSQQEIAQVFDCFECWAKHTHIEFSDNAPGLFQLDADTDAPPQYRELQSSIISGKTLGFNTAQLVGKLTDYISYLQHEDETLPEHSLEMPVRLSESVLTPLAQALGILTKRTFKRISSSGKIYLAAGLSASHYFSADAVEFDLQLSDPNRKDTNHADYYLNKSKRDDIWSSSFDSAPADSSIEMGPINFTSISGNSGRSSSHFQHHVLTLVNTSPGGYCIEWHGAVPGNVRAGELLAVREEESEPWSIGAIRWIRQLKQTGTQFGVELLAPKAKPCGVQLVQKTGDGSGFLRGLLLPELASIGKPTTLVTPRLPFQTKQKVIINTGGRETKVLLAKRVSATGSFSQFEIKYLSPAMLQAEKEMRETGTSEDEFDSLWPTL